MSTSSNKVYGNSSSGMSSIDTLINSMSPFNTILDTTSGIGSYSSNKLLNSQNNILTDSRYSSPFPELESKLDRTLNGIATRTDNLINFTPDVAHSVLKESSNKVSYSLDRINKSFNISRYGINDVKGGIVSANGTLCGQITSALQGALSKLSGAVTSLQRTALATADKLRKEIVDVVKSTYTNVIKVLPFVDTVDSASKQLKEAYKSVLSKLSSMVAIIKGMSNEIADCASLSASAVALGYNSSNYVNPILDQLTNSKDLVLGDFDTLLNEYQRYVNNAKDSIISKGLDWTGSSYLPTQIGKNLEESISSLETVKKNLNTVKPIVASNKQEEVESIISDIDEALTDIKNLDDSLVNETINIITDITKDITTVYEDMGNDVKEEIDLIQETNNEIFDDLLNQAESLDTKTLVETYITHCSESEFRTIIE